MGKLPGFTFYTGDWVKDPDLRRCSKAAKGVWVDMLCLMFECENRGVLATDDRPWSDQEIAGAVGGDIAENLSCIAELLDKGVASRNKFGSIFSRRMTRDERERQETKGRVRRYRKRSCNGDVTAKYEDENEEEKEVLILEVQDQNQNPQQKRKDRTGTRIPTGYKVSDEMRHFAQLNHLPDPDLHVAEFIDYWAAQPGQKGVKVDWDATFRNWLRRAPNFRTGGNGDGHKTATRRRNDDNRERIARIFGEDQPPDDVPAVIRQGSR